MGFENIAGYKEVKDVMLKYVNIITHKDEYKDVGIRIPNGILFYGSPGVGKTKLARSFAAMCGNVVELRAADCVVCNPAENIQEAFKKAKEKAPSVLLIDELDKIAEESEDYFMETNNNIMKILLQEIDLARTSGDVLIVATCNKYQNLNKALTRPGRFDVMMNIPVPGFSYRKEIISYYLDKIKLNKDVDVDTLAKITGDYTGAQLETLINEAGIEAYKREDKTLSMDVMHEVMSRICCKSVAYDVENKETAHILAAHEAGHALVSLKLNPNRYVIKASIQSQGQSQGHVAIAKQDELTSLEQLKEEILIYLAGRCSEELILHKPYASVSEDFKQAYDIAERLITVYGYRGVRYIYPAKASRFSEIKNEAELEIASLLEECLKETNKILQDNIDILTKIVKELEEKYVLSGKEIKQICNID